MLECVQKVISIKYHQNSMSAIVFGSDLSLSNDNLHLCSWPKEWILILYILFQKKINRYAFRVMYFIDFSPKKCVFFKKEKCAPHRIIVLY